MPVVLRRIRSRERMPSIVALGEKASEARERWQSGSQIEQCRTGKPLQISTGKRDRLLASAAGYRLSVRALGTTWIVEGIEVGPEVEEGFR
jgi:hypothetical protein